MAKPPVHKVELSVDWFVVKTIFQIIPICVNCKNKTNKKNKEKKEIL